MFGFFFWTDGTSPKTTSTTKTSKLIVSQYPVLFGKACRQWNSCCLWDNTVHGQVLTISRVHQVETSITLIPITNLAGVSTFLSQDSSTQYFFEWLSYMFVVLLHSFLKIFFSAPYIYIFMSIRPDVNSTWRWQTGLFLLSKLCCLKNACCMKATPSQWACDCSPGKPV